MALPAPSARLWLPMLVLAVACGGEERIQAPSLAVDPSVLIARPGVAVHPPLARDGGAPQFSYCTGGCPTDSSVVDFEGGWAPGFTPVDSQYAALGVVFGNAVVGEASDSFYNDSDYPPRSGSAIAAADFTPTGDWSGTLSLALDTSAVRIRGYVTSFSAVTLQCFNTADSLLAQTVFPGANLALQHGGPANQPVEVSAPGIRRCQFLGPNAKYTVDDLTVVWREPLPTLACDNVVRGTTGTCTVTGADSVLHWRFWGVLDSASRIITTDTIVADTSFVPDTTWAGTAVMSGTVSVLVRYGVGLDTVTLSVPWVVQARTGSPWRWGPADWTLTHAGTRLCPYSDVVLKPVGGGWQFTGPYAGRLAVNRRAANCVGGSIEPNMVAFPDSGTTIGQATGGPNASLHYVTANTFRISRVTEINDWLDSSASPLLTVNDSANYNACWDRLSTPKPTYGSPILRTLFTFNSTCADTGATTIVQRLFAHEEYGIQDSSSLATANGHEARRRLAAMDIANDPRAIVEPLVSRTTASDLKDLVELLVLGADSRISVIAGDHWKVNNNVIDTSSGDCLGAHVLRVPGAPYPRYYALYQFRMLLPDTVTIGCP